jgi:septal ring factor EnvC (AmiA/AmiB activator)
MPTIRLVPSIQQSIAADFLPGAFSSTLTSKHKIAMQEIYAILQNHFRSVTISRTQQSPLAGDHGIGIDDLTSVDLTRALHDLRDEIRAKDKQICNYQQIIHETERSVGELTLIIRAKDQDIRESHEKLSQAEHAIVEMMEQQMELTVRREREINELMIAIEELEQEIAKQKVDIAVLGVTAATSFHRTRSSPSKGNYDSSKLDSGSRGTHSNC